MSDTGKALANQLGGHVKNVEPAPALAQIIDRTDDTTRSN
jgi:hypothetical protein